MADFTTAYSLTKGNEGGYANHPADRGGETYAGISRNNFPKWEGWKIIDQLKLGRGIAQLDKALAANIQLQESVQRFYKTNFWDINKLDQVKSQPIANELFDTGVNMGVGIASRFLQRALNMTNRNQALYRDVSVDGIVGPATLTAVNNHPAPQLVYKVLNVLQGARYVEILERAPAQEIFANSWFSRVDFVKV